MYRYFNFALVLILLSSCRQTEMPAVAPLQKSEVKIDYWQDYGFVDSTTFKVSGRFLAFRATADRLVYIDIYRLGAAGLERLQSYDSLDSHFGNTRPVIEDINADGLLDFKLNYGSGARGSNEFYQVFIQDSLGRFTKIRNAEEKPNIAYDTLRKRITTTAYWAGTSYVDYILEGDSLIATEGLDVYFKPEHYTMRKYYRYDSLGNPVVYRLDSTADDGSSLYSREIED